VVNEKLVQNMCSGNSRERRRERCRILQEAVLAGLKISWHYPEDRKTSLRPADKTAGEMNWYEVQYTIL